MFASWHLCPNVQCQVYPSSANPVVPNNRIPELKLKTTKKPSIIFAVEAAAGLSTRFWPQALIALLALGLLSPLMLQLDLHYAGTVSETALKSKEVSDLSAICMAALTPLFLIIFLDTFFTEDLIGFAFSRNVLLIAFYIPSSLIYFLANKLPDISSVVIPLVSAQVFLMVSVILFYLCGIDKSWNYTSVAAGLILLFSNLILLMLGSYYKSSPVVIASLVFRYLCVAQFIVQLLRWAWETYLMWFASQQPFVQWLNHLGHLKYTSIVLTCTLSCCVGIYLIIVHAFTKTTPTGPMYTETFYCAHFVLMVFYSAIITILPSRITVATAARLRDQLDTKRTFVRYVSHEIR